VEAVKVLLEGQVTVVVVLSVVVAVVELLLESSFVLHEGRNKPAKRRSRKAMPKCFFKYFI
jgi:hypothetical protein